jgi:hypothetical protein
MESMAGATNRKGYMAGLLIQSVTGPATQVVQLAQQQQQQQQQQ